MGPPFFCTFPWAASSGNHGYFLPEDETAGGLPCDRVHACYRKTAWPQTLSLALQWLCALGQMTCLLCLDFPICKIGMVLESKVTMRSKLIHSGKVLRLVPGTCSQEILAAITVFPSKA